MATKEFEEYQRNRQILIKYLQHKLDICDWHAVSDVANDLRVLEAEYQAVKEAKELMELNISDDDPV